MISQAEVLGGLFLIETILFQRCVQQIYLDLLDMFLELVSLGWGRRGRFRREWRAGAGSLGRVERVKNDIFHQLVFAQGGINRALDHVLQLAHVSGPGVLRQLFARAV